MNNGEKKCIENPETSVPGLLSLCEEYVDYEQTITCC
jgi:hypothetical protein